MLGLLGIDECQGLYGLWRVGFFLAICVVSFIFGCRIGLQAHGIIEFFFFANKNFLSLHYRSVQHRGMRLKTHSHPPSTTVAMRRKAVVPPSQIAFTAIPPCLRRLPPHQSSHKEMRTPSSVPDNSISKCPFSDHQERQKNSLYCPYYHSQPIHPLDTTPLLLLSSLLHSRQPSISDSPYRTLEHHRYPSR